jgi:Domain of unknown function (DUF5668)
MSNRAALFAQAVRGPILLITLGLLFSAHQAGIVSFARTWPLILIVIGVMKLIERMVAQPVAPHFVQPSGPQPPFAGPPPAGPPPMGGALR